VVKYISLFVFRILYYGVLYSYVHKQNLISKSFLASDNIAIPAYSNNIANAFEYHMTLVLCVKVCLINCISSLSTVGGALAMDQLRKSRDTGTCFNQP